ncbi:deoxyuridine 5'-triphosphate nucleotidohydrolase-like protein [Leptotrombidium deliense]|uniref:Deoxyuridine 5'-triphosphate nucleotidohydrolase n=1 Tax=Leptotrombidium deliense TaxID=299467 RepID=A0A443S4Q4_9ACAR|nr:deoxyuridine 5'-triphosphate nucleotidohydrolase-like protein [Leptotrombidium deliense]
MEKYVRKNLEHDAGCDIECAKSGYIDPGETKKIKIANRFCLPIGYYATIHPRSSTASDGLLVHTTVIDAEYTGKFYIVVTNVGNSMHWYQKGKRLAQMIISPVTPTDFKMSNDVFNEDKLNEKLDTDDIRNFFRGKEGECTNHGMFTHPLPQKHTVNNKYKVALKSACFTKGFQNFEGDVIQWYSSPDMRHFTEEMVGTVEPCHVTSLSQFTEHINLKLYEMFMYTIKKKYDGMPVDCIPFLQADDENNQVKFGSGIFAKPEGGVLYHYVKVGSNIAKYLNIDNTQCLKASSLTGNCILNVNIKNYATHANFNKLKLMCNIADQPLYEFEYKDLFKTHEISELKFKQVNLTPEMKHIIFWFENENGKKVFNYCGNLMFVLKFKET